MEDLLGLVVSCSAQTSESQEQNLFLPGGQEVEDEYEDIQVPEEPRDHESASLGNKVPNLKRLKAD